MPTILPAADMTFLTLSALGVPPYSARGLQCSLKVIDGYANLLRDWNGALLDFSLPNWQKYALSIQGDDQQPPAIDGVWPGLLCTIGWPIEMAYLTGRPGSPGRTIVAGSSRTENGFTFYRPQFSCRIINFDMQGQEWEAGIGWTIEAEEA